MSVQTTSSLGLAALRREEGEVLRAYRDVVGRWTIGCGITSASGIKVTPGMTITRDQSAQMLASVLRNVYEPPVRTAMQGAKQHEFDAGVSFHFNTGAIGRASWVNAWIVGQWDGVRAGLLKWVKGGGKVLPGLKARREREFIMMRDGFYKLLAADPAPSRKVKNARIALPLSAAELASVRAGLRTLGYDPGPDERAIRLVAVTRFQAAHDLTVDAVIGRATLSTLQRRLNARSDTAAGAAAATGGGALVSTTGAPDALWSSGSVGLIVLALGLASLAVTAWCYRDAVAAKIAPRLPKLAAWLRAR